MTALLQVLHAGSYALTHLGTIYFIRRKLDEDFAGTAQGLFGAISGGVIMTGAIWLSGWAYATQGGAAYAWMAAHVRARAGAGGGPQTLNPIARVVAGTSVSRRSGCPDCGPSPAIADHRGQRPLPSVR
jgi:hypothetical protein